jgi:hypothetical protein
MADIIIYNIMNSLKKLFVSGSFIFSLILLSHSPALADEVLWESGLNLYIKITDQDSKIKPNQHPITLDAREVANALNQILILDRKFVKEDELKTVFTIQQATLLGQYLASGLQKANPDEDIVFALVSNKRSYVVLKETYYLAGRAFYADDRLHVIIGDYDKLPDKFRERAESSHGNTSGVQYFFDNGKRTKASGFKHVVITKDGIDNYKEGGSKLRRDWFVIDVNQASNAYVAQTEANKKLDPNEANAELIRQESARMARERREMRMEMARLRKEMSESQGSGSLTVEDRLKQLDELKDKGLISSEEYDIKRQEILSDI